MLTKKMSMKVDVGIQTIHPLSKTVQKRTLQKYEGRRSKSSRAKQSTRSTGLTLNHFQSLDLVKFVKQRRAVAFDPSYTTDTLFNIFDKVRFEQ
jgi:hypothetical protein